MLRERLLRFMKDKENVVIGFSFWSRKNRDFYRAVITKAGGSTELSDMKTSKELCKKVSDE